MRHTFVFGALLCLFSHPSDSLSGDKVRLKDVQVLTLRQGQYTTGRRSHPVPQLNCRGGSAGCEDQPSVVQCYNRGSDGRDTQWECKAEMKKSQKFGLIQVTCEGYDYPQDEYILVGSCGLEYYLERTGFFSGSSPSVSGQHRHNGYTRSTRAFWSFVNVIFFVLAALGFCVFCLCCLFLCTADTPHYSQGRSAYGAGYRPLVIQSGACHRSPPPVHGLYDIPPPYSASQYLNTNYVRGARGRALTLVHSKHLPPAGILKPRRKARITTNRTTSCGPVISPASTSQGPGFWTGAATGGLLGYLFGNRGCDTGERTVHAAPIERTFEPVSFFGNSCTSDGYTATGFGGTDRR
ncbi:store-operated calcium entry-associated regulatory factor-like isoform X2 [Dermacentor andersoni]|uniref:store-operated calcium entry-associated regulatory factor-like isoform X2 n=1 Tax=Dermacentor andersoni TaxID=34620 RepID=UPI002415D19F|nr:store-operated calcium entry-associated regulatory factor-like isoform X2 [Dermacentor andersoni]